MTQFYNKKGLFNHCHKPIHTKDHLNKLFFSTQNTGQLFEIISSTLLTYYGNYLSAIVTTSWVKISWIINYGT